MKAMIWKELRESSTWAVLALALVTIAQIFAYNMNEVTQDPLRHWDGLISLNTLCAVVAGGGLGAAQILPELRRDQWAFLLHRPATASHLFAGKAIAGLLMLALVISVPNTVTFCWLRYRLGYEIISPWYLLISIYIGFAIGSIFYFCAMIAALRPARIYGTRLLSVVTAIFIAFAFVAVSALWQSLLIVAFCLVILVTAALGCFAARGEYRRMVAPTRMALGLVLLVGGTALVFSVATLVASLIPEYFGKKVYYEEVPVIEEPIELTAFDSFIANPSGRVLRTRWQYKNEENKTTRQFFLKANTMPEGQPLLIPRINGPHEDFIPMQLLHGAGEKLAYDNSVVAARTKSFLQGPLTKINEDKEKLTYYDEVARRIVFYSLKTKRIIGYSGPVGYYDVDATVPAEQAYFRGNLLSRPKDRFFWFAREVFRIDGGGRVVKRIIQAQPGQVIRDLVAVESGNTHHFWVVQNKVVEQYDTEGKRLCTIALKPDEQSSRYIGVVSVASGKHLLWLADIQKTWEGAPSLYSKILETASTGKILRRFNLPVLPMDGAVEISPVRFLSGIALPFLRNDSKVLEKSEAAIAEVFGYSYVTPNARIPLLFTLSSALFSCMLAWFITGRAGLTLPVRLFWAAVALPLGLGAVLALLALCAWPVRLVCERCGKKRNIERESCKHCHALWPRPRRDGTEILSREFETHALVSGGRQ